MARKMTEQEQKRTEAFNEKSAQLQSKGYSMKQITVGVVIGNIMTFVIMLPLIAIVVGLFYITGGHFFVPDLAECSILFVLMLVSMPIHEWIHGFTWGRFSENGMKDIEYGVIWQMLTPYCTCKAPLKKLHYILGSMMPTIVLGVLVAGIGICISSFFLVIIGCYNIFAGGGDFNIIIRLLCYKTPNKDVIFMDHPTELGLVVFEKK